MAVVVPSLCTWTAHAPRVPGGSCLQRGRRDGRAAGSRVARRCLTGFPLMPVSGPAWSSRSWRRILCSLELLCQAARVRALTESPTCANVQTLVSSYEASDKFHSSVYREKHFSAFYLGPWSLVMTKGKDRISLDTDF